jgi:hypothetical protein
MAVLKCPDCGTWWQGNEHRCPVNTTGTSTAPMEVPWRWTPYVKPPLTGDATVRCTCPPSRGDNYLGMCPVHDVTILYKGWA